MADPRPMMYVTTDAVAFALSPGGGLRLLLIRRRNEPYKGRWALPGGFVDEDEDLPDACARELEEETALRPAAMAQIGAWGKPGRDPRGRNVCVAYLAVVRPGEEEAVAGDDAASAAWHAMDDLPPMAFDHADIVAAGLAELRLLARRTHLLFAFLPDRFGLDDSRAACQALLGRDVTADEALALARRARLEEGPTSGAGQRLYRCVAGDFLFPLPGP